MIRERVTKARKLQSARFSDSEKVHYNAQMGVKQIRAFCKLDKASLDLLKTAMERLNLSARAYDRILKVSRTIADLEASEHITGDHISEAYNTGVWIEMGGWGSTLSDFATKGGK